MCWGSRCDHERHLQEVTFELHLEGCQRRSVVDHGSIVDDEYILSLGKIKKNMSLEIVGTQLSGLSISDSSCVLSTLGPSQVSRHS